VAGRRTLLTADRRDDLSVLLAHNVPTEVAARAVGVSSRSVRRWKAERDLRERADELRAAGDKATDTTTEARLVVLLMRAAEHDWRASAWYLERRHPSRWALR
jgi:transposase